MSQPPYAPPPPAGGPNPSYQNPGQPNPGYQHPTYPAPGYQPPPGQGQYPGYQNAPPPPSGYGAGGGMPPPPPGWGAGQSQQAMTRPSTVKYAMYALLANLVLSLIASVLIFANQDAYLDEALRDAGLDPDSTSTSAIVDSAYTVGAIIGLVFVALWAMFLWFAWKGHNWARIVIWVLGGLSLFGIFTAFSSPVGTVVVVNVLSLLLTLAAVVLLALKPSNDWYRYQGNARKYGWPGRA
ncbi:MAG: hypothetical protein M3313_03335 [Actinomycetota bacterium]|nr:hypothetical protein [Actinomycetota bacterium]